MIPWIHRSSRAMGSAGPSAGRFLPGLPGASGVGIMLCSGLVYSCGRITQRA